jgi:succinate-semialdehyde dehydrogenase/glutarate-semialdehyde dehydrogenase
MKITNPATLAPLGEVPESGVDDIHRTMAAAGAAARAWHATTGACRAELLKQIGSRVRESARDLAELSTEESGLARCESLDCVRAAAAIFDFYATHAAAGGAGRAGNAGDRRGEGDDGSLGTVAVFAPFSLPLPVMAASVGRALAEGLSVVYKPPAENPLTSLALASAFDGLPAGVVNLVTGGPAVGRLLLAHPGVGQILFTGSAAVGLEIAAVARGKRLDLEVGTVDAHIVCRGVDLDLAVPAIAWTRLMSGGQSRMSGGHLYVERSLAAEFVDRMHHCVGFLDVDDPCRPCTDLGPLISHEAAVKLEDQVGRTLRAGAKLILGGRRFRPSGLPGHFFQPTILTDVKPGSVPMREQLLGPVITVTPMADLAEALRLWKEFSSPWALSPATASIYTADADAAAGAVEAMPDGFFRINDPSVGDLGPLGGLHHRGIRNALGTVADESRNRPTKRVEMSRTIERRPWWFPYIDRSGGPLDARPPSEARAS